MISGNRKGQAVKMPRNTYGLDLGSYEIKVYDKRQDSIWREKDVIALRDNKEIYAVGDEAYIMYEKTPSDIHVTFPMEDGVIAHFDDMQYLLENLLKKVGRQFAVGSEYVIAVPTDVSEVEKKAFFDLVIHSTARAREVNIVERSIADAVGIGIDVSNTNGVFIVNFGGATTELSMIAGGGLVMNELVKIGGEDFDRAIISLVRHRHDFLIGRRTAEALRKQFRVYSGDSEPAFTVAGRDLITGVPMQKVIDLGLVRTALSDPMLEIVRAIQALLDRTPPEIRKAVYENGIYLTGGVAQMDGLDTYIEQAVKIPAHMVDDPDLCVINGIRKIIRTPELGKLAYSMLDDNYRWMR